MIYKYFQLQQIYAECSGTVTWIGGTTGSYTHAQFVRLGGT